MEDYVKEHPSIFSEIYHQRFVNNIYFDSLRMKNYYDSINGASERIKVRIRWYGDIRNNIDNPVLELKLKNGSVGNKLSYPLISFRFDEDIDKINIKDILQKSEIPFDIIYKFEHVFPTLINRYRRKYYQSTDRKYRLTLDDNISFYKSIKQLKSCMNSYPAKQNLVLELKYDTAFESGAKKIANHFPFRLSQYSKYVEGINFIQIF